MSEAEIIAKQQSSFIAKQQSGFIIRPGDNFHFDLGELFSFRELLLALVVRDVKVRYKDTLLGVGWVLFQPTVTTFVFSIFFGQLAKIPSDGLPYPIFVFAGLLIWNFFSASVTNLGGSLVTSEGLIKKVYFPRLIVPLAAILTSLVDFLVGVVFFLLVAALFGLAMGPWSVILLLAVLSLLVILACGVGLFLAVVRVQFRDVWYVVPLAMQLGLFMTPVIYPLSMVSNYRWLLALNPLTGIIENFRLGLKGESLDGALLGISFIIAVIVFVVGLVYFQKRVGEVVDNL